MKQIDDLPLEIHEKILSYLMTDPFTLHRIELVCQLWASIIRFFENKRGLNFRRIKVFNSNEILIPFRSNLSRDIILNNISFMIMNSNINMLYIISLDLSFKTNYFLYYKKFAKYMLA